MIVALRTFFLVPSVAIAMGVLGSRRLCGCFLGVGWMDRLMNGHPQSGVLSLLSGVLRRVRSATGPPVKSTTLRGLGSRRLRGQSPRSMKCQTRRLSDFFPPQRFNGKKGAPTLHVRIRSCGTSWPHNGDERDFELLIDVLGRDVLLLPVHPDEVGAVYVFAPSPTAYPCPHRNLLSTVQIREPHD